jgi:N-acetylneuraminic acid mutarotase
MRLLYLPAILMILQTPVGSCRSHANMVEIEWKEPVPLPSTGDGDAIGIAGPVTGIIDDLLLVGGGANFPHGLPWEGGKKQFQQQLHLYLLTEKGACTYWKTTSFPELTSYGCSYSTSKGVVLAGGEGENGISSAVWLLEKTDTGIAVKALPALPIPLTNAAGTSIQDQLFIAGGETLTGMSNRFFSLSMNDLATGWKELPALPYPVSHAVLQARSVNSRKELILAGGRARNNTDTSQLYDETWLYSLDPETWKKLGNLPFTLAAAQAIRMKDESILLLGGEDGSTFSQVEKLLGAIQRETDSMKKAAFIHQKNELQRNHPGFRKKILVLPVDDNQWLFAGDVPFDPPVTTSLLRWNNYLLLPSGEIKAGVRSPYIQIGELNRSR